MGAAVQPETLAWAEGLLEQRGVPGTQLRQRADTHPAKLGHGLRPDAWDQARRLAGEALQRLLAREHDEAGRLAQLAGDLGQHAALRDADRAGEARLLADLAGD